MTSAAAGGLDQPVGDDRDRGDREARHEAEADIGLGERDIDLLTEVAGADEGGDDEHGKRQHDGLVEAEQHLGQRQRQADSGGELQGRATRGDPRLDGDLRRVRG